MGDTPGAADFITESAAAIERAQVYRLMTGIVVPRPIALVSTLSKTGIANLAPFSFFNVLSIEPPMVGISIGDRHGVNYKDTRVNIDETGEFVVNVVSRPIAGPMNEASLDWDADIDEFEITGLTPLFSNLVVKPPRVAESPAHLECRLFKILPMGDYHLVIGEVVAFHRRKDVAANKPYVDQRLLDAVGRMAGSSYCSTTDLFSMRRNADSPEAGNKTGS